MIEYSPAFDISDEQLDYVWLIGFGAVGVVTGLVIAWFADAKAWGYTVSFLFVVVISFALWTNSRQLRALQHARETGDVLVVEGPVTNFRADSLRGDSQVFFVNGQRFSVSRLSQSPGFHNTVQAGGPDLTNKCVRVLTTRGGEIVWLGVRECGNSDHTPRPPPP